MLVGDYTFKLSTLVELYSLKMKSFRFNYSTKNIPIPPRNTYTIKKLIEKVESVIKRMRWKAYFFDNDIGNSENNSNKYGFKSRNCPPQNNDMEKLEDDVLLMIKNIEFRRVNNDFQSKLKDDIKKISSSNNVFVFADKTANMYELSKDQYDKLLRDNITSTYRKTNDSIIKSVNKEANGIAVKLGIQDRVERMAIKH